MLENIGHSPKFTKANYDLAKKNNDLERFRGDEISWRIAKKYPLLQWLFRHQVIIN